MNRRIAYISTATLMAMFFNGITCAAEPVGIKSINVRTGIVTAYDAGSRQTVEFKVVDAVLLKSLKVGQTIYANYETQEVSVDNLKSCCNISRIRPDVKN